METDDPIVALMARLEALIENVIDRKFTERDQRLEKMAAILDVTHDLVNSRVEQLTKALKAVAGLEIALAGEAGEERGIAIGRKQASESPPDDR